MSVQCGDRADGVVALAFLVRAGSNSGAVDRDRIGVHDGRGTGMNAAVLSVTPWLTDLYMSTRSTYDDNQFLG